MRKNKGFTLIELMIVIAIIAIIAAIAIPNLLQSRMRANEASSITQIRNYGNAQLIFITGKQGRLSSNSAAAGTGYCNNYRNLYYGNPVVGDDSGVLSADTGNALRLISKAHADAYFAVPTIPTVPTAPETPGAQTVFNGYYYGNPTEASADSFYDLLYAQLAVPAHSSRTGTKALFYDDNGTVMSKTLEANKTFTDVQTMNTPITTTSKGWEIN